MIANDPLVAMLVVWVVSSTTTGLALWLDRRRLGPEGRRRMWREATLWAAVSNLFIIPPPIAFGAHVWVTRTWRWWVRLPAALGAAAALLAVVVAVSELVLWVLERALG